MESPKSAQDGGGEGVTEKAFRLDFFIAVAALLVSAVSAIALIYQTHVIGAQYAATIWPYLTVNENYTGRAEQIVLTNDGVGPALIRSAHLEVDGRSVNSWTAYISPLMAEVKAAQRVRGQRMQFTAQGIGAGSTLRSGDAVTLLSFSYTRGIAGAATAALLKHRLVLRFCYCSLNGSCWNMRAASTGPISSQVPVHGCGAPSIITASTDMLQNPAPKK